jgi:integrase
MIAVSQCRHSRHFVLTKVGECLYRSECGSYFAVVKHLGKQHRKSLQTKDRGIAAKKLGEFRQKLRHFAPTAGNIPAAVTFGQIAKMWLESISIHLQKTTYIRRAYCINASLRTFKNRPIVKITLLDCERWATKRNKNVKARTFNCDLETMRLVFNYAISHGLVMDNPALGIRRRRLDTASVVIPSRQQFKMLIADMRLRAVNSADIVEFLAYSGCRSGEAHEVRWSDVDFASKTLRINIGDTGTKKHTRSIPLFPPLERLLRDMLARLPKPPKPNDHVLADINAGWALTTACRRLGLPPYHRHTMRHFFCSTAIEAGVNVLTVSKWAGHRDAQMICRVYGHASEGQSTAMARRMVFDAGDAMKSETAASGTTPRSDP